VKRRAKIIATVGPASSSKEQILALVEAGMDVARLNFSHGKYADHAAIIGHLRSVSRETDRAITILQDLRGPKLRTGLIPGDGSIQLTAGERITLTTEPTESSSERVYVNYAALPEDVKPGDRILLDDGRMELEVLATEGTEVATKIVIGGDLRNNKGINLPGVALSAPCLTEKDRSDLAFGLKHDIDAIAMSFVRQPEDLDTLSAAIKKLAREGQNPPIIAKLERPEAIEHLEGILDACAGVMVARGDLGVELSAERLPSLQKHIIQRANAKSRLVITATQMLDSMIAHPRPTRAEASDVANAVFDGSDALMLSGETAIGAYPIQTTITMARIISDAEQHAVEWGQERIDLQYTDDDAVATTYAARGLAHDRNVAAIAVFTRSGRTAQLMSKARPAVPILALTPEPETYQRMALFWGVDPYLGPKANSVEEMLERVRAVCLRSTVVKQGDQVVIVASLPIGAMGPPNFTLLTTV
jgi:pyruvate kinase